MNPRIKELIAQATRQEAYYPAGNDGHPDYRLYFNEELFAQLIVEECANKIAESFIPEDELIEDYKKDWDSAMRFAANSIKQHFGVDK